MYTFVYFIDTAQIIPMNSLLVCFRKHHIFFFFLGSIISCYLQTTTKIWPYLYSKLCTRVSIRYINVHTYTLIGLMKKRSEFYYIVFSFVYTWFVLFCFVFCMYMLKGEISYSNYLRNNGRKR